MRSSGHQPNHVSDMKLQPLLPRLRFTASSVFLVNESSILSGPLGYPWSGPFLRWRCDPAVRLDAVPGANQNLIGEFSAPDPLAW